VHEHPLFRAGHCQAAAAAGVVRVCMSTLCSVQVTVREAAMAQGGGGCDGGRGAMAWTMALGPGKAATRFVAVAQRWQ
jgi:hypothetical protein